MSDLNFQNISTVQSGLQPTPATLASAATIAPSTFLTFLTGTTSIATITPPVSGSHMLCLVSTDSGTTNATVTTGNIIKASTFVQNKALLMVYDPVGNKYYPSY
jgi:hypothetical protein